MGLASAGLLADLPRRLELARHGAAAAGLDALLISPGSDLRYLTGYQAVPLERLTCLIVRSAADPVLLVPELEQAAALASPVADLGLAVATWPETADPYRQVAGILGPTRAVGVDNHMWAEKVLRLAAVMPDTRQALAGQVIAPLRMRKSGAEVAALETAGAAIDSVHAAVAEWLRPGRTEAEVGADIADAIRAAGHATVDFVIVAAGPNGASPHHEVSHRVIGPGEPVVIDIGGTTPDGYCSDSTRMYCIGEPPADFLDYYETLELAQAAAVAAVAPGVTCEAIDRTAREVLAAAGWAEHFIHRTGHGIGMETHEEPYLVAGNTLPLEPGMAFSVEPGVYLPDRHGARIEDIVVCGPGGPLVLNDRPRSLVIV